jgi:tungstate transport system permease protein
LIGSHEFKGKDWVLRITNTLMGLPPVVAGLAVFLLLSRSGPLGTLKLLYSVTAMVIAQTVLITPIMAGLTATLISITAPRIRETAQGVGIPAWRQMGLMIYESRSQLVSTVLAGFGRAIAEVGAVQIVGGNVQYKTRVMTTAIMMQTNMGQFQFAIALGIVLLIISFGVNALVNYLDSRGLA